MTVARLLPDHNDYHKQNEMTLSVSISQTTSSSLTTSPTAETHTRVVSIPQFNACQQTTTTCHISNSIRNSIPSSNQGQLQATTGNINTRNSKRNRDNYLLTYLNYQSAESLLNGQCFPIAPNINTPQLKTMDPSVMLQPNK